MRVKRFVADTMQEAIARVKEEYGPDAVILQTRTYRRGLFGLLGARRTEVLAAVDPAPRRGGVAPARAGFSGREATAPATPGFRPSPEPAARPAWPAPPVSPAAQERAVLLGQAPSPSTVPWSGEAPTAGRPAPVGGLAGDGVPERPVAALQDGWTRSAAGAVLPAAGSEAAPASNGHARPGGEVARPGLLTVRSIQDDSLPPLPEALERVYQRLVERAVEPVFARRVVEGVLPLLPPGVPVSVERATVLTRDHLASLIPVSPSLRLGAGPRRVVVLVGPTGVGKTTSLAKLAAHHGLMAGHPVGLLTFDTYRVGAAEQLRTYAEIIGLPMEVVYHPGELPACLERMADRHLILVDTAGRSPHDLMRLQELRSYLRLLPEPEVYLVLSATVRFADLVRAAERFEPLGYRHLILTKVDETTAPGMVLNAVFHTGRPLAYLSTGQDVPDDFEAADPDRIAAQLLEDSDE